MTLPGGRATLIAGLALILGLAGGYGVRVLQERAALHDLYLGRKADPTTGAGYRHRVSHFALLPAGPRVVMLGDSLTANAQWAELLGRPTANRGVPGDTAGGLLARLDASMPASADTVFVMIGINDLKDRHVPPATVAARTAAVVRRLAPRRVFLQSVLFTSEPALNAQVADLNARNRALCATGACVYVDLNAAEAPDGKLSRGLSRDGLHLGGVGYQRWAAVIRPLLPPPSPAEAAAR